MTLSERLKYARKAAHLTQQALADTVLLKQNTIATYESGKVSPSERSISDIARACHVDENWLRSGDGSPELKMTTYEEIGSYFDKSLAGNLDDSKTRLFHALSRLDADGWDIVATLAEKLSGK